MQILNNITLADYTSWLIGGPAQYFALPTTLSELKDAYLWAEKNQQSVTVLGGGSNVLISDAGIRGLVICLKKFTKLQVNEIQGRLQIEATAGIGKAELLKVFLKYQLAPALFLAGLPGDVGGGVVMNAGVAENFTPREFHEIVDWVEVLRIQNGTVHEIRMTKQEINWSYRHSNGWQPGIISRVGLSWPLQPDRTILESVRQANKIRLTKQPLDLPSCGSVFVNPPGAKAAQLIDQCGLKGFQVGGAQVSLKHANFIVNLGGAKASDILKIIDHVQETVFAKTHIQLKTEVVRLGL